MRRTLTTLLIGAVITIIPATSFGFNNGRLNNPKNAAFMLSSCQKIADLRIPVLKNIVDWYAYELSSKANSKGSDEDNLARDIYYSILNSLNHELSFMWNDDNTGCKDVFLPIEMVDHYCSEESNSRFCDNQLEKISGKNYIILPVNIEIEKPSVSHKQSKWVEAQKQYKRFVGPLDMCIDTLKVTESLVESEMDAERDFYWLSSAGWIYDNFEKWCNGTTFSEKMVGEYRKAHEISLSPLVFTQKGDSKYTFSDINIAKKEFRLANTSTLSDSEREKAKREFDEKQNVFLERFIQVYKKIEDCNELTRQVTNQISSVIMDRRRSISAYSPWQKNASSDAERTLGRLKKTLNIYNETCSGTTISSEVVKNYCDGYEGYPNKSCQEELKKVGSSYKFSKLGLPDEISMSPETLVEKNIDGRKVRGKVINEEVQEVAWFDNILNIFQSEEPQAIISEEFDSCNSELATISQAHDERSRWQRKLDQAITTESRNSLNGAVADHTKAIRERTDRYNKSCSGSANFNEATYQHFCSDGYGSPCQTGFIEKTGKGYTFKELSSDRRPDQIKVNYTNKAVPKFDIEEERTTEIKKESIKTTPKYKAYIGPKQSSKPQETKEVEKEERSWSSGIIERVMEFFPKYE